VVGPHPGFQVNFGFRLVGMGGVAAGDYEGNLASLAPGSPAEHRYFAGGRV
jgi:hypothetical protein